MGERERECRLGRQQEETSGRSCCFLRPFYFVVALRVAGFAFEHLPCACFLFLYPLHQKKGNEHTPPSLPSYLPMVFVSVRSRSTRLSSCVGASSSCTSSRSPLPCSRPDKARYQALKKRLRASNSVLSSATTPTSESSQQVSEQLPTVEEQRKAAREMIAYFQEK